MSVRITADQARALLEAVTTAQDRFDAPPWTEVGPQEHGESDLDTRTGRYGPMPREVAELAAAAPELAATVIAQAETLELVRRIAGTQAMTARATGQWQAERNALDLLAILDAEAVTGDE